MQILTSQNFEDYLRKSYDNYIKEEDFLEDLNRFKHIKKLLTRYISNGPDELRERLILNHLIVLYNVFGPEATSRVIFLRMQDVLPYIKPFLVYIGILPQLIVNIEKESVLDTDEINMDKHIVEALRTL